MTQDVRTRGLRFDPTINAGHVLTFVSLMVAGAGAWMAIDKRIVVLEEARVAQAQRDGLQDTSLKETRERLEKGQERMDAKLDRILDKLSK